MNRIRELRKRYGVGQQELAEAIGVTRPTISDWDLGKKNPTAERLEKLSDFFGVSKGVILGYEEMPSPVPVIFVDNGEEDAPQQILKIRELIKRDPERSVLFRMSTKADIRNIRRAIAILNALEAVDGNDISE